MNETREMASFVVATDYEDFPENVREQAKMCVLDYLGCALYGSTTEWCKYLGDFVKTVGCKEECTVIGNSWKTSEPYAALMNGTMGHGFELDDSHSKCFLHPGVVIIPAALAVGEKECVNGKKFLMAVVLGYEIMCRLGLVLGISHAMRGHHATGTNGTFGAAAAAGKLLNLNEEQMASALGVAGSFSSGLKEFYLRGDMVKRLHAGRAAEGGVMAASLASRGFTGPSTVLEGKYGYFNVFSDDSNLLKLKENLKKEWEILNINVKPYACCRGIHATIDGLLVLAKKYNMKPKEIEKIVVGTNRKAAEQNSGPGTESIMAAQFSIPFSAALTLLKDIEDPSIYNETTLKDENVISLSKRVEVVNSIEGPGMEEARVAVELKDGQKYSIEIKNPKGNPENPFSPKEIIEKFKKLTRGLIPDKTAEKITDTILHLDTVTDIKDLCKLNRLG